MSPDIWGVLGIEPTQDIAVIRRAYASVLKRTRPEDDPAGFVSLRQAYESALAQARVTAMIVEKSAPIVVTLSAAETRVTKVAPVPVVAEPAGPAPEPVVTLPSEIEQLRSAFQALRQAARAAPPADPATLRQLLHTCLTAPALESLTIQLQFETQMVHFLNQTWPTTGCLLAPVIAHWKWDTRLRTRQGPGITALLAHADDLRAQEQLPVTAPLVYRALTEKPQLAWLWFNIIFLNLHVRVRQVLRQFHSTTPRIFDTTALQWWTRFLNEPHLSPMLMRATGVLMLVGGVWGAMRAPPGYPWGWTVAGILGGGLLGLTLAGLWLKMVDLPRYRFRAIRSGTLPRRMRLGWALACLGACLFAPLWPDTLTHRLVAVGMSYLLLSAIVPVAPGFSDLEVAHLRRVLGLLVMNLPLIIWWVTMMTVPGVAPTVPMSIILATTLLAFALGQPLLWAEFLHELSLEWRQRARWGVVGLALSGLVMAVVTPTVGPGSRVRLMVLVVIVLVARTAAANLTLTQARIKAQVGLISSLYLLPAFGYDQNIPALTVSGVVFMVGVMAVTALSLANDWRAGREAAPVVV